MLITRGVKPERDFAIISNTLLRDTSLSFRARGILCCILSHAEGYRISSDRLVDMGLEGRDAIRSSLAELESVGYLKRTKTQDAKGQWSTNAIISDTPDFGGPAEPTTGKPTPEKPASDNRASVFQALKEDKEEDKKKKKEAVPKISFDGLKFQDLSVGQIEVWSAAYPAISVTAEILKAAVWLDANPANQKSDYKRFLNNWLCRAQDKAPARAAQQQAPRQAAPRYASTAQTTADRRAATLAGLTGQDNNTQGQDHARTIDAQSRFI